MSTTEKFLRFFFNANIVAGNVLRYFKMHEVYVPENVRFGNVEFFGPPVKKPLVKASDFKQLPQGDEKNKS